MQQLFKARWILPANGKIIENGAFLVENGKIIRVFLNNDSENLDNYEIVDYENAVITPGFINLHTHLQFSDLEKDLVKLKSADFSEWIITLMKNYSKLSAEQKITSFNNGLKEAILSGTTCVCQISREKEFFEILNKSNIKAYYFIEAFSCDEKSSSDAFEQIKSSFGEMRKILTNSTYLGLSPHSFYNCHVDLWEKIFKFAYENEILVQSHFAESVEELLWIEHGFSQVDEIHKFVGWDKIYPFKTGLNPLEYLKELKFIDKYKNNVIFAHVNQLDNNSFQYLIKEFNVNIAHCPRSNIYLHNKTIDVGFLNDKNLSDKVGLGTDSKFSNFDLSMLNEARYLFKNSVLNLLEILDLMTINPAKILKLNDVTGSIEEGKDADFLVFKLEEEEDYSGFIQKSAPDDVYVKGNPVVQNMKLL